MTIKAEVTMNDLTEFITRDGDSLLTDSRAVAIAFSKPHRTVLRAIDRMHLSADPIIAAHCLHNLVQTTYADSQGRVQPMYRMSQDGFMELAMGFTGDQSRVVRIRFIAAFREVSHRLFERERSITERLHALTRREAPSELKGSIGSMLLHQRKREKPELAAERALLESLSQPSLIN